MGNIVIPDEAYASIGQPSASRRGLVNAEHIRRFAAAIDDSNPIFHDKSAARALGYADIVAPPLFAAAVTRPIPWRSEILEDGQFDNTAPPGLTHLQTMLAGQRWELVRPVVAGELVEENITTKAITPREGKHGPMIFVDRVSTLSVEAEIVERQTLTIMLREPPQPPPPASATPSFPVGSSRRAATEFVEGGMVKTPDMVSVFMFSAAIWAIHRIHYDAPYAHLEGLPGPVVPGWMLASYLAQLAGLHAPPESRLRLIDVRYRASASPGDSLMCRALSPVEAERKSLVMTNQLNVQIATANVDYESLM